MFFEFAIADEEDPEDHSSLVRYEADLLQQF
jgi:hypothetical protein